jgi:16S rRNA (guanine527-N7)-methyltransferase
VAALDPAGFQKAMADLGIDVSHETIDRLKIYAGLVAKWHAAINLIGHNTLQELWHRHFLDSAQLLPLIGPQERQIADFGSGAGFPGLVIAIMSDRHVHLIESDSRKCAFLRQVAIETNVLSRAVIHNARAEKLPQFPVDVATARACAPLDKLIGLMAPFVGKGGRCLVHKGRRADEELTRARKVWKMRVQQTKSMTDPDASILILSDIQARKKRT